MLVNCAVTLFEVEGVSLTGNDSEATACIRPEAGPVASGVVTGPKDTGAPTGLPLTKNCTLPLSGSTLGSGNRTAVMSACSTVMSLYWTGFGDAEEVDFVLDFTFTLKVQLALLPARSVAVQVTVVSPTGNDEPEGGLQVNVTPGQLSVTVGFG